MSTDYVPLVGLPATLSDEAATQLVEILLEIAHVLEDRYAVQIYRNYRPVDDPPDDIWPDDGPPF